MPGLAKIAALLGLALGACLCAGHAEAGGPTGSARFRVAQVRARKACTVAQAHLVRETLIKRGAATDSESSRAAPLDVEVQCDALGPVPHTYVRAVAVRARATSGGQPLADVTAYGFGEDDSEAIVAGLERAAVDLAAALAGRERGQVLLRVRSPLPSSRVRRLIKAVRRIRSVRRVEVAGIDPDGAVRLQVHGELSAKALANRMQALSLPDFSVRIARVEGPDALTVALQ